MNPISCDEYAPSGPGHETTSSKQVVLADGTRQDAAVLSLVELETLQWEQDRDFAARILASPRGSLQRTLAVRQAYNTIPTIFAEMQNKAGQNKAGQNKAGQNKAGQNKAGESDALGMDNRYTLLVTKLLKLQQSRNMTPSFLEIGFGSGRLLKSVAEQGHPIVGIEASKPLRDKAAELLGPEHEKRLLVTDFLAYRPGPGPGTGTGQPPFTIVYWNDVFEHIPPDEIQYYIKKIHELLVPGGSLVTITPNWHLRPSDATAIHHPPRTEAQGLHLKEYTLREVTAMLRRAGFARVDVPLAFTRKNILLMGNGFAGTKRLFEPALEWLPFRLAQILCRGLSLYCTIATKSPR